MLVGRLCGEGDCVKRETVLVGRLCEEGDCVSRETV